MFFEFLALLGGPLHYANLAATTNVGQSANNNVEQVANVERLVSNVGPFMASPQASHSGDLFHLEGQLSPTQVNPNLIAQASIWKVFQPDEGGFEVLMPGQPAPLGASFKVEGIPLQLRQYITSQQNDTVIYMVGWTDLPPSRLSQVSDQESLNSIRDGFRDRLQGRLVHEFQVQLAGSPGRHFKMQAVVDNRYYSVTQRIYLKGSRVYQLTAMVPQRIEFNLTQSIAGFLKSFTFVPLKS